MANEESKTQSMEKVEAEEEEEVSEEEKSEKKVLPWWKGKRSKCGLIVGVCALVIAGGAGIAITTGNVNPVDTLAGVNRNADSKNQTQINDTDSESEASQVDKKAEEAKEEAANNASATTSGGNASSGSTSTPASGNSSSSSAHTHSWTPVYKTVHHDAVTHTEDTYDTVWKSAVYCTKHKCQIDDSVQWCTRSNDYGTGHCMANTTVKEWQERVKTGSKTVTDVAAFDEQVVAGYACSCGATK